MLYTGSALISARRQKIGRGTYIGASDKAQEGQWVWSDGTPWDYDNWSGGLPSPIHGAEDCAMVWNDNSQLWNDMSCDQHSGGYACSYNLKGRISCM